MTLATFFEKFDQFADARDAVAKMRELVLELAVRGRLIPSGKPKPSALSDPSAPFPIPADWRWSILSEAADCGASAKVSPSAIADTAWVLDLEDIDGTTGQVIQFATFAERRSLSTKAAFETGDVLYGKLRPYLNKVVVAEKPGYCTTEIIPLRPAPFVSPAFLRLYLRAQTFLLYAAQKNYGMKMPRLGTKDLESAEIPLPPLAEQKRIVAKVDELMALCDRLEAQQQEREARHAALARASLARFADAPTPANLQLLFHPSYPISPADLRKSILTLAVQGKLVPQDPNDEPATSLLTQIARKKQAMIKAKEVRQGKVSRPHSALDAPMELPTGWEWVNVDSLCFKVTDGTHFTPQYAASGVRFVSAKDIVSGKLVFDRCKFITQEEHDQLYRRCNPEYHDIVISKSGSIGTVALVEDREEFSLFESLALLKFDQAGLFPAFLVCTLTHACASLTTGHIRGVGVKHLHLDILRGLEMALPPLAEQRRIVAKVDQLMALVDELETQLAASRATAANLLSAVVAELTSPEKSV